MGSIQSLFESASVIVCSEIGDKTFFLAAIMAMRHRPTIIFNGAMAANFVMILLSVALGQLAQFIPIGLTKWISALLFFIFGGKALNEAWRMDPNEAMEEYEEAEQEIRNQEKETKSDGRDMKIFWQIFALTFLGEWGDRSQLATILLSATKNSMAILIGGTIGHVLSTGAAVTCGDLIGKRISLKLVTSISGLLFIIFGVSAITNDWSENPVPEM